MTEPLHTLSNDEPIVRLANRIVAKVLEDRGRTDLLDGMQDARIEATDEGGLRLTIADETIDVDPDAVRLGLSLQPQFEHRDN